MGVGLLWMGPIMACHGQDAHSSALPTLPLPQSGLVWDHGAAVPRDEREPTANMGCHLFPSPVQPLTPANC